MFDYTVLLDVGSTVFFSCPSGKKIKPYICHVIQNKRICVNVLLI